MNMLLCCTATAAILVMQHWNESTWIFFLHDWWLKSSIWISKIWGGEKITDLQTPSWTHERHLLFLSFDTANFGRVEGRRSEAAGSTLLPHDLLFFLASWHWPMPQYCITFYFFSLFLSASPLLFSFPRTSLAKTQTVIHKLIIKPGIDLSICSYISISMFLANLIWKASHTKTYALCI